MSPGRALAARAIAAIVLLGTMACGSPLPSPNAFADVDRPNSIQLTVQNFNFSEVRLFALKRTGREPIGIVPGKENREFQLDWPMSEPLSIEINMLAGPRCVTERLEVDPGDLLELQVAVNFEQTRGCR